VAAYRIFTQAPGGTLDPAHLLVQARRFFEAAVEVLAVDGDGVHLALESEARGYVGRFVVRARAVSERDLEEARAAEARGRAAGMSALAARCAHLWELEPLDDTPPAATLNLCALLASIALGPVLPPDAATLFGVRGAMERVERLCASEKGN
jgi:hypothetical protein